MVTIIAVKELREMWRDGRFSWTVATVTALLALACIVGGFEQIRSRSERAAAERSAQEVWLGQAPKDPHQAAHFGTFVFKPEGPLSAVDPGIDPYVSVAIFLEAHRQNLGSYLPAADRRPAQKLAALTAAAFLQVLLPLVIIILAAGAFAREREQGTIHQLLASGAASGAVVKGKILGTGVAIAAALSPAVLFGAVALGLTTDMHGAAMTVSRTAIMAAGYLAYVSVVLVVALAVSACCANVRLAFTILLGFWIWNCLLAPRVWSNAAEALHPNISAAELYARIEEDVAKGLGQDGTATERNRRFRDELLKRYGVDDLRKLPVNAGALSLQNGEEYAARVFDKHFDELWGVYEAQLDTMRWASIMSPLLAVRNLSMAMAGTDLPHYRRFADAAEQYRRKMVRILNEDLAQHPASGPEDLRKERYTADRKVWALVGEFGYPQPPTTWAFVNEAVSALFLGVWFVVACGATLVATRRLSHPA